MGAPEQPKAREGLVSMASTMAVAAGAWRQHAAALFLVILGIGLLYQDTFSEMIGIWTRSRTFNHCFLVLPIALFLGYSRRHILQRVEPATSVLGAVFLAFNAFVWLAGNVLSAAALEQAAAVGLLIGAGWSLIGNVAFRVLALPFLYLYFAVPFGEFLVPALQDWTAAVLVWALRVSGMPVFIEGRYLSIPSGNFVVAEACSGINYLIATLAVGTMYMYLNFSAWWRRVAFMLAAIAVPLIANGLRAYGIVMIAHYSDYRYAMGVDHFIYGWVFFGVVIFALFALTAPFSDRTEATDLASLPIGRQSARAHAEPLPMGLLLLVLLALPHALTAIADQREVPPAGLAPPEIAGWQGPLEGQGRIGAEFRGATAMQSWRYVNESAREVSVQIAYYARDDEGAELINQTNRVFDETRWKRVGETQRAGPAGTAIQQVNVLQLRRVDTREDYVLWLWYEADNVRSANPFTVKLAQARARLGLGKPGSIAIMLLTREADAGEVLEQFARQPGLHLSELVVPAE